MHLHETFKKLSETELIDFFLLFCYHSALCKNGHACVIDPKWNLWSLQFQLHQIWHSREYLRIWRWQLLPGYKSDPQVDRRATPARTTIFREVLSNNILSTIIITGSLALAVNTLSHGSNLDDANLSAIFVPIFSSPPKKLLVFSSLFTPWKQQQRRKKTIVQHEDRWETAA